MASYLDKLIIGICGKLQLPSHLYALANERYQTISNIIQNDGAFDDIELRMYPHGSFRLKTTVKPLNGNEYDLDFVVELPTNANMTPRQLYDHVYRILSKDGTHNDMVEKKNRCIRINYANDFHMDIMPAQEINRVTNEIIVPDRELKEWYHHSNPIGYAEWFEEQARSRIIYELNESRRIQCSAEPIDEQEIVARLEPLRRAVQLIKRYRDIYCDEKNANPVRSIVLCTLMGNISSSYSNELDIMNDFCTYVNGRIATANGKPFEVKNPVVDEVLTEKWTEDYQNYTDFVNMMKAFTEDMGRLQRAKTSIEIIMQMKSMFGETVTNDVVKEQTQDIEKARNDGTLAVGTNGLLNTKAGTPIKKNTFYGE